ncbi:MAG TPA: hypothetical protein VEU51_01385 [Candidatus Acidoferrales bacterium]|nr:hypothetical protein [Candidatus Acidoferrales bacterium]
MKRIAAVLFALVVAGCAGASHDTESPARDKAGAPESAPDTSAAAASSLPAPKVETPPTYHKGYKLTFRSRNTTFDVTYEGVQDGLLVFHYDTRDKLPYDYLYTPDLKLAAIYDAQQQSRFDPAVGYLSFPLVVGGKWDVSYKVTSNSRHSMGEISVEVMAFEPVHVPYGTLNAFRIRVRSSDREVGRMNPFETYWYSPDIGYFVKHETNKPVYEDPYELIAVSK